MSPVVTRKLILKK